MNIKKALLKDFDNFLRPNKQNLQVGDFVYFGPRKFYLCLGIKPPIGQITIIFKANGYLLANLEQITGNKKNMPIGIPLNDLQKLDSLKAHIIIANEKKK